MIAPLQTAIYSALTGDAALMALVNGVYDQVPQDDIDASVAANYPYVVIHGQQLNNNDTDTEEGFDGTVTIHTWSQSYGNKESYEVMQAVYRALHRVNLSVVGYGLSTIHQEYSELMRDPDGITRHGVQRFRVILEPTI